MSIREDAAEIGQIEEETISWDPLDPERRQHLLGAGLHRLQLWLMEMRGQKSLVEGEEGILHLNSEVSRRFAIGILRHSGVMVMPEREASWAGLVPWSAAAMYEEDPTLYLVMNAFDIDGVEGANFALSFRIPDLAKASALMQKSDLQLRRLVGTHDNWSIEPTAMLTLPLEIVEAGSGVFDKRKRKLKFKGRGRI